MTSREVVSKMAQLIPVAVLREYQMDEENYLRSQMAYRAKRIASFKERDIPHIVERFTSEVGDRDVRDCVLCLYILEDLSIIKDSDSCTQALRHALQQVDSRVTDVYMGINNTYGTPHAEDMKMFDVFVFFEDSEPREEETAG